MRTKRTRTRCAVQRQAAKRRKRDGYCKEESMSSGISPQISQQNDLSGGVGVCAGSMYVCGRQTSVDEKAAWEWDDGRPLLRRGAVSGCLCVVYVQSGRARHPVLYSPAISHLKRSRDPVLRNTGGHKFYHDPKRGRELLFRRHAVEQSKKEWIVLLYVVVPKQNMQVGSTVRISQQLCTLAAGECVHVTSTTMSKRCNARPSLSWGFVMLTKVNNKDCA